MPWNEPGKGNSKENDPWKNQGNKNQGPPDLDVFFKNFFQKFFGAFGGSGKSSTPGSSLGGIGLTILVILILAIWAVSGFFTVKEAERAIVLRFGDYDRTVGPGLGWRPTFVDEVILVDVQSVRSLRASGDMLTQDENVVLVDFEIQYRVVDPRAYKFSVTNADDSLHQAMDSALRFVVGHSEMTDILTAGRETIRQNTWDELVKIIESYNLGLDIVDVNFKDARPPEAVKAAFDDAISAQEDEERFIREAEAYAREMEPRARGRVRRVGQESEAYMGRVILEAEGEVARFKQILPQYKLAPEVTRQRLYLETMEKVFSNTSKVIVDVNGGGNMMYLPLDKMIQQSNKTTINSRNISNDAGLSGVQSLRDLTPKSGTPSSPENEDNRMDRFDRGGER